MHKDARVCMKRQNKINKSIVDGDQSFRCDQPGAKFQRSCCPTSTARRRQKCAVSLTNAEGLSALGRRVYFVGVYGPHSAKGVDVTRGNKDVWAEVILN